MNELKRNTNCEKGEDDLTKKDIDCNSYNNEIFVAEGSVATHETTSDTSEFNYRLLNDNCQGELKDSSSVYNECINGQIFKCEQNYSSDEHLLRDFKQEIEDQVDSSDISIKEETHIVDEENKNVIDHHIHNEQNKWNNDAGYLLEQNCSSDDQFLTEVKQEIEDQEDSINVLDMEMIDGKNKIIFDQYMFNEQKMWNNDDGNQWELNCSSDDQLLTEVKQEITEQEESINVLFKEDTETIDEDDKIILDHCISNERKMCYNESGNLGPEITKIADAVPKKRKTYKCNLCDYQAYFKSFIKHHMESVHSEEEKNFKCQMCYYKTTRQPYLTQHISLVHLKSGVSERQICYDPAPRTAELERNVEAVHGKIEKMNWKCEICEYGASRKSQLRKHVESVHLKKRDFKCHMCHYAAFRNAELKRHVEAVHLKQKNFNCDFCDYQAFSKHHLKVHMDSVHSRKDESNVIMDHSIRLNNKKKECQQRYREQNREKFKQRETERRKRIQYSQGVTEPSSSSNINRIELNNEEIIDVSSSGLEGTQISSVPRSEHAKEKSALQKKSERQQRYREHNREKLNQRAVERRKRIQYLQSIAGTYTSSSINRLEEIIDANSQSSGLEGTLTSSVQRNEQSKEKNALQKKRERQQRYREQNREKLKQREWERRQRLRYSEMITESSTSSNIEFKEIINQPKYL